MIKVRRALLSVSDKTGILTLARGLTAMGVEVDFNRGHGAHAAQRRGRGQGRL